MGNSLIICEKPSAAQHIAKALNISPQIKKRTKYGMPYFQIRTKKGDAIVCSAIGHFYQVDSKYRFDRRKYPIYDIAWKPKYLIERGSKIHEKWVKAINELAKDVDIFINACDYDIEGSLIGYMILKYACGDVVKKAKRMKYSSLIRKELLESFENFSSNLDFPLVNAGICRHELDWIYGINLSIVLTESARKFSNKYFTLSTGRVQGPTLKFIVEREKEILKFIPSPFWTIKAILDLNGSLVEAEYELNKLETRHSADKVVKYSQGEFGRVESLEKKIHRLHPPPPFDLTSLQTEAYRYFRFSPRQTLDIAQRLYLSALISYPRTSSQKLPKSIGFKDVLNKLSEIKEYKELCKKLLLRNSLKPNEGKKSDPAHPAIYPTGVIPSINSYNKDRRIYDLIVRRFLATFGEIGLKQINKATIRIFDKIFYIKGSRILQRGWIDYYEPYVKFEEVLLPKITKGDRARFVKVVVEEKHTKPLPRYNPSSIIKLMEKEKIGTKTTRADILDVLYRRGYIKGDVIIPTSLAFKVNEVLKKCCQKITEVSFTRKLEDMMDDIESGKCDRKEVIIRAIEELKPIIEDLREHEYEIGKELGETIKKIKFDENTLKTRCPQCNSKLFIVRSKKTRKRFIGCNGAWQNKCKFSLPLPQYGSLTLMEKYCTECEFQLIQVKNKGRRPMIACPHCYVYKGKKKLKKLI